MVQVGGAFYIPFPEGGVRDPLSFDASARWDGSEWDGSLWDGGPVSGGMWTLCDSVCGRAGLSCFAFDTDAGERMVECIECAFSP
jgi:hypothetical protein